MADRKQDRNDPRRGEPTARRNFRDEYEGAGPYGGSYTAGGPVGAGYGGGYEAYDEGRRSTEGGYGEIQGASYGRSWGGPAEIGGGEGYRRPDYTGRGPRGYRRSDIRINEDVCDALTQDSLLDASEVEVRVQDGEVTLSGAVESRQMKRRAEDIADSVRGVVDVHNRLRIDPAAAATTRADRGLDRDVALEGGSSADVMEPGGPAEAYTRAQGTEAGESDGT